VGRSGPRGITLTGRGHDMTDAQINQLLGFGRCLSWADLMNRQFETEMDASIERRCGQGTRVALVRVN